MAATDVGLVVVEKENSSPQPQQQQQPSSLMIQTPVLPTMNDMEVLWKLAQKAAQSSLLKSNQTGEARVADAFFLMMYGTEIGLHPMTALRTIYVVNGTPTCSGQAMLALGKRAGFEFEIQDISTVTESATVKVRRPGSKTWREHTYTKEMAVKAGLWGSKDPWKKHTAEMLIWRAVAVAIRLEAPDVIAGLYLVDEIAAGNLDLDENGEPINFAQQANRMPIEVKRVDDGDDPTGQKAANQMAEDLGKQLTGQDSDQKKAASGGQGATSPENKNGNAGSGNKTPPPAEHWAKDKNKLKPIDAFIKGAFKGDAKAAMGLLVPGADKWSLFPLETYPTPQSWIDAVKAKLDAGAAEPVDENAMEQWCQANLNLSEKEVLAQIMDKSSWQGNYQNTKAAQEAVKTVVNKDQFAVVSNRAQYNKEKNHYIFLTVIGPVLFFGHDSIKALVGEEYFDKAGFADWNEREFPEPEIIHDVLIEWKTGKSGGYREATKFTEISLGDIPF